MVIPPLRIDRSAESLSLPNFMKFYLDLSDSAATEANLESMAFVIRPFIVQSRVWPESFRFDRDTISKLLDICC